MFKVGKRYEFRLLELDGAGYARITEEGVVSKVEGPLIVVDEIKIINTHAPTFESAIALEDSHRHEESVSPRFPNDP